MTQADSQQATAADDGVPDGRDPFDLFGDWLEDAEVSEPNDANAMALATVDAEGLPSVRMVLLKGIDDRGFVFYTNMQSDKGNELAAVPKAAACFHWKSLRRQVRIRGPVEQVSDAEADAYFATRPRGSQIGAWASEQSRVLADRSQLEGRIRDVDSRYDGKAVPRPPHWTGFRIVPVRVEFWQDRQFRLHDRLAYSRSADGWETARLYP